MLYSLVEKSNINQQVRGRGEGRGEGTGRGIRFREEVLGWNGKLKVWEELEIRMQRGRRAEV